MEMFEAKLENSEFLGVVEHAIFLRVDRGIVTYDSNQ